jgi:hypothetical protein
VLHRICLACVRIKITFASMSVHKEAKRITTQVLHEMKQNGERIAMLTAYDFSMTRLVDQAGIDIILVGQKELLWLSIYPLGLTKVILRKL